MPFPRVQQTTYTSKNVEVPGDFLKALPADATPIALSHVNFAKGKLPEYEKCYAVVIDNVLSPSECETLLKLAEASAEGQGWRPAMINAGVGFEVLLTDSRNSDRIIWDSPELVDRLWARCLQAPGLKQDLATIHKNEAVQGGYESKTDVTWVMTRLNERMRFLKYGRGQFFKQHTDGTFAVPDHPKCERSFYTLQLYLSSSKGVKGGTTRFLSRDRKRKLDVEPVLGRVLLFQHRSLIHTGEEVRKGIKYTMRTDLMYELQDDAEENETKTGKD